MPANPHKKVLKVTEETPVPGFEDIRAKAQKALEKKPNFGPDVDTSTYQEGNKDAMQWSSLSEVPEDDSKWLLNVGVDTSGKDRSGTYVQTGDTVSFCATQSSNVEILPTYEALQKYKWLGEYSWNAVPADSDKFTAEVALVEGPTLGYFIRAKPGVKEIFPLQACLYIDIEGAKQRVHNIIIAEEGSELNIITGCSAKHGIERAMHMGISEFYVKKNAKVSFTMIHNWPIGADIRPRTGVKVEENGYFNTNYIMMSPVKSLQLNPQVYLNGANSKLFAQTLIYAMKQANIDAGTVAHLNGPNTSAEIISRVVATDEAQILSRGDIHGRGDGSKGHLSCDGLLLSKKAGIRAIPMLNGVNPDSRLSHEAAVGKIAQEQILYLMSRGLDEDQATAMILRGFLEADTHHLPPALAAETERLIKSAADSAM